MDRLPLSVAIIAYNEEDIIGRTLESVKDIAAEIIVVDSHSTDRTREIAKSYGAKVYIEDWKGYASQMNSAFEKCSQEWILFLDADEIVSIELQESIKKELKDPKADGYLINRQTYYLGGFLKHVWQPEYRLRLVNRRAKPKWVRESHGYLTIASDKISKLNGNLYHFSYKGLQHQMLKGTTLAKRVAKIKIDERKNVSFMRDIILRPIWAFFKTFFLKKGFLDGKKGFIISVITSYYTFMKYSFLYEEKLKEIFGHRLWERDQI